MIGKAHETGCTSVGRRSPGSAPSWLSNTGSEGGKEHPWPLIAGCKPLFRRERADRVRIDADRSPNRSSEAVDREPPPGFAMPGFAIRLAGCMFIGPFARFRASL